MALGDLRLQPCQAQAQGEPPGDEALNFDLRAAALGGRNVPHAALEHLRVGGVVLEVAVVVVEQRGIDAHPAHGEIRLQAGFPGIDGLVGEGRQHDDGRHDVLAAIGEVAAARLEAAREGAVQHRLFADVDFQRQAPGDGVALGGENGRAGAPEEVRHRRIDFVVRMARSGDDARRIRQRKRALAVHGERIALRHRIRDEAVVAEREGAHVGHADGIEDAVEAEIQVFADAHFHFGVQVEDARHPIEPSASRGDQVELLGERALAVDLRIEDRRHQAERRQRGQIVAVVVAHHGDVVVLVAGERLEGHRGEIPLRHHAVEGGVQGEQPRRILRQRTRIPGGIENALLRRAVGVLALRLRRHVQAEPARTRRPRQPGAGRLIVCLVQSLVEHDVVAETGVAVGGGRRPQRRIVAERHVQRRPGANQIVVAEGHVRRAEEETRLRRCRNDVHRPAGGILPEQRALRPAQHLHALDIEEVVVQGERRGDVDAVQVVGDGRIGDGVLIRFVADAANGNDGLEALVLGHRDARHGRPEIHEREDVARRQVFGGCHRNRLGQVLEVLGPLLGGDDDLLEHRTRRCALPRLPLLGLGSGRRTAAEEQEQQRCAGKRGARPRKKHVLGLSWAAKAFSAHKRRQPAASLRLALNPTTAGSELHAEGGVDSATLAVPALRSRR